jgi:uncharacterized membrane protein
VATAPVFVSYVLSFVYVGIYWNNHHHMLHVTERVNGAILWANLHLLFWLSLIPFVTGWMGENNFAPAPTALHGVVLLAAAIAYRILQRVIIAEHGEASLLATAIGGDLKGKLSVLLYAVAFLQQWVSGGIYVLTCRTFRGLRKKLRSSPVRRARPSTLAAVNLAPAVRHGCPSAGLACPLGTSTAAGSSVRPTYPSLPLATVKKSLPASCEAGASWRPKVNEPTTNKAPSRELRRMKEPIGQCRTPADTKVVAFGAVIPIR